MKTKQTKKMRNDLTIMLLLFIVSMDSYCQNIVTTEDLKTILGEWTGTLTYIDYNTDKPFSMPANLIVTQGKNNNQLILDIKYPKEPNANSKDKIRISKDGSQLNKLDIESKVILPNGQTEITTQYIGKDNGKKALIKNIYTIRNDKFIIRKEVKFENSDVWRMRSEYNYNRKI